jgi:hypothetical protein
MHINEPTVDAAHANDHGLCDEGAAVAADKSRSGGQAIEAGDLSNQKSSQSDGLLAPRPLRRSYLDDPDHARVLDPASLDADAETVLENLLRRNASLDDLELIFRGAAQLFEAHAGTAAECLDTSVIWLYG